MSSNCKWNREIGVGDSWWNQSNSNYKNINSYSDWIGFATYKSHARQINSDEPNLADSRK